jgi:ElaA protein
MNKIRWSWKSFSELSAVDIYNIIAVREEVFIVEQGLNYVDCDGLDLDAFHLVGQRDEKVVAYLRAFPPGIKYSESSLGRVLCKKQVRGEGLGKELIQIGLDYMFKTFGPVPVKISAQSYLQKFYEDFGFEIVGEEYLEEGIPHLKMVKK